MGTYCAGPLPPLAIPATLHNDLLMARTRPLSSSGKGGGAARGVYRSGVLA